MNINNYFTFFCQLAHLGVNKIRATIKTGYTNALSLDQTAAKKKERDHFKQRTSNRKSRAILTVVGTTAGQFI